MNGEKTDTSDKVTILLATYNGTRYLPELLASLLNQTYTNWELIIRDDNSKDETPALLKEYADKDERFNIIYGEKNIGPSANFSELVKAANGKRYIMFCDQDDVWRQDKIEATYHRMKQCEERHGLTTPILVFCGKQLVDEKLQPLSKYKEGQFPKTEIWDILIQNPVYGCTMMVNGAMINLATPIPEYVQMHDYYFALYASANGYIEYLDRPLIYYRQHSGNVTGGINNFSFFSKIKDIRTVNKKLHESMRQNYEFCKRQGLGSAYTRNYIDLIQSRKVKRLHKAHVLRYRLCGIPQTIRLLFALITY